ncbi:MAG: NAD(P)H-dependent oxidoreductase [Rubrivivax sp.]|nr:NAD(P)H-dependent oxidoreductase [Rubrivivax sp.]
MASAAAENPAASDASAARAAITVIAAHPALEHSRITRRLMDAAAGVGAAPDGPAVDVRDLYHLYPDYFIDVAAEQAALGAAQLVVWLQPIHWYSMPPLMKLWLDEVFAFGWAYGPGGTALRGKDLWLVASTGGPEHSYHPAGYNRYFFDAYLPPYEQTARLAGMRWLPPLVLHGAHRVDEAGLGAHAGLFAERLRQWPEWPELEDLEPAAACEVPADARPAPGGEPAPAAAPALHGARQVRRTARDAHGP